ncbi:MAG: hypothetical protein H6842_04615 [Rhodospirillaceae bacterium]|nr:hypothetical protein [Rhodospirillaceae bacterium]
MSEEDEIMAARELVPKATRVLAEIARTGDGEAAARAIANLHSRGFIDTPTPSDDQLLSIENMTDDEIKAILWAQMH